MKLTNRLLCIASKVPNKSIVADVGTDHAYIPVYLVKNKISKKVIASDINKGPLNRAKKQIEVNNFKQYIETRLGAGLEILDPNETDTVIIAGMGGVLITNILKNSPEVVNTIKRFILQPMTAQEVVRKWLYDNNFKIVDEELSKEDSKIYTIIVAEHGIDKMDNAIYYEVGKKLFENKDPLLIKFLERKINKNKKILKSLENQDSKSAMERKLECENKIFEYNKLLKKVT